MANPTLTAIFVVITGMIGASFGPWLMDRLGHHPSGLAGIGARARSRMGKAPPKPPAKASFPVPSPRWRWARGDMYLVGRALAHSAFPRLRNTFHPAKDTAGVPTRYPKHVRVGRETPWQWASSRRTRLSAVRTSRKLSNGRC